MNQQPSKDRPPAGEGWPRVRGRSEDEDDELLLIPLWRRCGASQAELIRFVWSTGVHSVEVLGPDTAEELREFFARLRPSEGGGSSEEPPGRASARPAPVDRPLPAIGAFDFSDLPDDVSERVEELVYGEGP